MAKHILHTTQDIFDFVLLGIGSADNQYVLVNNINEGLGIELSLNQNLHFTFKKHDLFEFSVYHYSDDELAIEYYLVPNKSNNKPTQSGGGSPDLFSNSRETVEESALLISELPHTNYFLMLKGDNAIHEQYKVFKFLKEIHGIMHVHEIIPEKLQSRNNLIF